MLNATTSRSRLIMGRSLLLLLLLRWCMLMMSQWGRSPRLLLLLLLLLWRLLDRFFGVTGRRVQVLESLRQFLGVLGRRLIRRLLLLLLLLTRSRALRGLYGRRHGRRGCRHSVQLFVVRLSRRRVVSHQQRFHVGASHGSSTTKIVSCSCSALLCSID